MKEFIEYLVKAIVTNPDDVSVTPITSNGITIYSVTVNDEDMGLVIGKQGRIIKSIRDLAIAKAIKENLRVRIELNETRPKEL